MLQAVPDRILFTTQPTARTSPAAPAFSEQDVQEAVRAFNSANSLVTSALRKQFQASARSPVGQRPDHRRVRARLALDRPRSRRLPRHGTGRTLPARGRGRVPPPGLLRPDGDDHRAQRRPVRLRAGRPVVLRQPDPTPIGASPIANSRSSITSPACGSVQAFSALLNANYAAALAAGRRQFAINYGMAGIGSEILANRLGRRPDGQRRRRGPEIRGVLPQLVGRAAIRRWSSTCRPTREPGGRHHGSGAQVAKPLFTSNLDNGPDRRALERRGSSADRCSRRVQRPRESTLSDKAIVLDQSRTG